MKNVRLVRKDENAVSPVIATILMVAITVVLAAVLYVMVSGLIGGPGTTPVAMGVNIRQTGANWSVEIATAPSGKVPTLTYLLIKDQNGVIKLAKTAFSALTLANWNTNKAQFQDANPSVTDIRAGDSLLIDRVTYPSGTIEISDDASTLTARSLV
jgi:flagellin-like protein